MTDKDLESKTKSELLIVAKKLKITGRSLLTKDKLIKKIEKILKKKKNVIKPKLKVKTVKEEAKRKVKSKAKKEVKKRKKTNASRLKKEVVLKTSLVEKKKQEKPVKKAIKKQEAPKTYKEEVHERFYEEVPRAEELPSVYGEDKLVLQVRDPYWAHAYWELRPETQNNLKMQLGEEKFNKSDRVLRIYDVTDIDFDGTNAWRTFDLFVGGADSWYINLGSVNRSYHAQMGYLTSSGEFYSLICSNVIHTPSDGPSTVIDEEWMLVEEKFKEMYALSGGGRSKVASPQFKEIFESRWLSWNLSSEGVSTFSKQKE